MAAAPCVVAALGYSATTMGEAARRDDILRSELPTEATDHTLAVAAHEGDVAAQLALIERYTAPLFNLVHRTTGMNHVADEITRTVLAAAVAELDLRVPPAGERWMARLARDVWRQLLALDLRPDRPAQRVRIAPKHWDLDVLHLAEDTRPSPRRAGQKLRQRLWRAWSALTLRERFVLTLCDTARLTVDELAVALGESPSAARARRDEAKLALMAHLTARRPAWSTWFDDQRRDRGRTAP